MIFNNNHRCTYYTSNVPNTTIKYRYSGTTVQVQIMMKGSYVPVAVAGCKEEVKRIIVFINFESSWGQLG